MILIFILIFLFLFKLYLILFAFHDTFTLTTVHMLYFFFFKLWYKNRMLSFWRQHVLSRTFSKCSLWVVLPLYFAPFFSFLFIFNFPLTFPFFYLIFTPHHNLTLCILSLSPSHAIKTANKTMPVLVNIDLLLFHFVHLTTSFCTFWLKLWLWRSRRWWKLVLNTALTCWLHTHRDFFRLTWQYLFRATNWNCLCLWCLLAVWL